MNIPTFIFDLTLEQQAQMKILEHTIENFSKAELIERILQVIKLNYILRNTLDNHVRKEFTMEQKQKQYE